tara:strand:- start:1336 stop:1653 length:318 start_codon:yes stop_codon:yes gene_type:complete
MAIKPDTKPTFAPIVVGAVYARQRYVDVTEEVLCIASMNDRGTIKGLFRRVGYADETHTEGTEAMVGWTLVYNPREIAESLKLIQAVPKGVLAEPKARRATRARK